ncbi:tetratricopeptide repeat protein [Streptomyces sp. NPDC006733]|uniref:tetratricopeptide repeat protein n=1 Tax=Streptomyces sp. NPDC006733 TaxID=3155460 RepID=UPI0034056357
MTGRFEAHGQADGQGRVYQAAGDQHIIEHHHHSPTWTSPDSVRHPAVGRISLILRDRTELMARLRDAVAPDAGGDAYVLHGLGGSGKTAVAYALFRHATAHTGRVGLWVNASDTASLRTGMLAVAADRGADEGALTAARSGLRAAADLVWDSLQHSAEPWLLVLDNADDPTVIRDGGWLRTSPRGTVLVTTRQASPHWWPDTRLLSVGVLPREAAAQVLCDLAPETGTPDEAAEVADRLGRLPLALTLAGGFLSRQVIEPWTMTRYSSVLDDRREVDPIELLDQGASATAQGPRHLVRTTWQLSLDALEAQGLPEAVTLLRLLSCWAGDPLPVSLLAGVDVGARGAETALHGLLDHSLTELVAQQVRCLRTHGVLLDSVARGIPPEQREQLVAAAARRLDAALPEIPERQSPDPRFTLLAPHALALLRRAVSWPDIGQAAFEAAADCALRLTVALHRSGDYASALILVSQARGLAGHRLAGDHPVMLRLRRREGRALDRLGRFAEAETVLRATLADCERVCGPEGLDTLDTCLNLAVTLWHGDADRTPEAVALVRRATHGRTTALGPAHPLTLLARSHLLCLPPGPELQHELVSQATLVAECQSVLGEHHPIALAAALDYTYALYATGRLAEALPRARTVLAAHQRRYGPDFPMTLAAWNVLGQILTGLGAHAEALEATAAVVEARVRVLGPTHPYTREAQERLTGLRTA